MGHSRKNFNISQPTSVSTEENILYETLHRIQLSHYYNRIMKKKCDDRVIVLMYL